MINNTRFNCFAFVRFFSFYILLCPPVLWIFSKYFFYHSTSEIQLFIVTSFCDSIQILFCFVLLALLYSQNEWEWMNGYVSVYGWVSTLREGILIWKISTSNTNTHTHTLHNNILILFLFFFFINLTIEIRIIRKETTHSYIYDTSQPNGTIWNGMHTHVRITTIAFEFGPKENLCVRKLHPFFYLQIWDLARWRVQYQCSWNITFSTVTHHKNDRQ